MKQSILKLLWLDDHRLIHKSRSYGLICLWSSLFILLLSIVGWIYIQKEIDGISQITNEVVTNIINDPQLDADNPNLQPFLKLLGADFPEFLNDLALPYWSFVVAIVSAIASAGLLYIRYNQIINKIIPNQSIEAIVTTPVD